MLIPGIRFKPQLGFMIIDKVNEAKSLVMPDDVTPTENDIFVVMDVNQNEDCIEKDELPISVGDLVCIVGYINSFRYRGEKVILARTKDVVCKIEEKI